MFQMLKQFFQMFYVLFSAGEKGARAIEHLATWSEETAGSFADESRLQRQAKLRDMSKELNLNQPVATPKAVK